MLGAIVGDIVGSVYELDVIREYDKKYPSSYGLRFGDWFDDSEGRVMELAKRSAEVTHNDPEGIKGAQATATAILWARQGVPRQQIRRDIEARFGYDLGTSVDELQRTYQYNEICQQTVLEAIACFLEMPSGDQS
jgi:ADP-ribosylglycohydrolase